MICFTLGYPIACLQSTHVWMAQFAAAMRAPDDAGVLKTFPLLADLSRWRNGAVVMLLYLASQHARLQFHSDAKADADQAKDVRPYRALDRAHTNATRMLTRMLGAAVGCVKQGYGGTTLTAKTVRRFFHWVLGPGNPNFKVFGVLRWQAVADTAAGVTARRPDSLQKSHKNRKAGPLSAVVWGEAHAYIHNAFFPTPLRSVKSVALGIGYVLIVYYFFRLVIFAAQHIAHALG